MQDLLAIIAAIFYGLSAVYFFVKFLRKHIKTERLALLFLILGLISHGLNILVFALEHHRFPAASLAEASSSVTWLMLLLYTFFSRRDSMEVVGIILLPVAVLALVFAEIHGLNEQLHEPIIRIEWVYIHIPIMILSVATLTLTFLLAVVYLLQERQLKSRNPAFLFYRLPSLETCEDLASKSLRFGFFLLTLGILTGMVLSKTVHGRYWSWDYKEIWALITWVLYAVLVHGRMLAAWRGRKAAYLAIVLFALMLFTFAGVSVIFKSYHAF
ncbi:MAG TPA: cytochrome c biogenesis protein CcsA [Acidobacteriota bacterium]|nr:cytochrome c biogenesis protein CcsA [Acidobacteriota bacterium]